MKYFGFNLGMSRNKVRNQGIRKKKCEQRSLPEQVDHNILKWFGYMERMDEGRITKRIFREMQPDGVMI